MATDLTMQQREDRAKQQYEDHEKALQKIKEFTSCGRVVEFAMDFNARMKGAAVHFAEQSIRAERERGEAVRLIEWITKRRDELEADSDGSEDLRHFLFKEWINGWDKVYAFLAAHPANGGQDE